MRLIAALLLLTHASAWAGTYRCEGANGKLSFQQAPCPQGAKSQVLEASGPWLRGLQITETSGDGDTKLMYSGNLFRRLAPDGSGAIVDLDQRRVTMLDKAKGTATVSTVQEALSLGMLGFAIGIFQMQPPKPLGERRKILNHECEQYEARAVILFPVSVTYCLSTTAPGVAVVAEFSKKMLAQLPQGHDRLLGSAPAGIMLASESSFGDSTRVTRIEEEALIAQSMFEVPRGYRTELLQDTFGSGAGDKPADTKRQHGEKP